MALLDRSKEQIKSELTESRLYLLDDILNNGLAKALKVAYSAKFVSKCLPQYLGYSLYGELHSKMTYGHVQVDNKYFRVSTCIDLKNKLVHVPKADEQFFSSCENAYFCFVTTNLFFCIKASSLMKLPHCVDSTDNYEVLIDDILKSRYKVVAGLYDSTKVELENGTVALLSEVNLPASFFEVKIRGCKKSFKPRYALIKNGTTYCEYFSSIDALKRSHPDVKTSNQYLNRIARSNLSLLVSCYLGTDKIRHDYLDDCKKVLSKGKEYVLVLLDGLTERAKSVTAIVEDCAAKRQQVEADLIRENSKQLDKASLAAFVQQCTGRKPLNLNDVIRVWGSTKESMIEALAMNQMRLTANG